MVPRRTNNFHLILMACDTKKCLFISIEKKNKRKHKKIVDHFYLLLLLITEIPLGIFPTTTTNPLFKQLKLSNQTLYIQKCSKVLTEKETVSIRRMYIILCSGREKLQLLFSIYIGRENSVMCADIFSVIFFFCTDLKKKWKHPSKTQEFLIKSLKCQRHTLQNPISEF